METQVTPSSSPRSTVIGSVRTFRTGCASRSGTRPAAPCCMTPRRATRMVRTPFASWAAAASSSAKVPEMEMLVLDEVDEVVDLPPIAGVRIPRWDLGALGPRTCPLCHSTNRASLRRPDALPVAYCRRCALWYVCEAPSDDQVARFYDNYWGGHRPAELSAPSAAQMMQQLSVEGQLPSVGGYERILPKLAAALGGLPGKRILEVGCGYGSLLLAARLQGAQVIGNDISGDAVRFLREQLNIPGFDVPFAQCVKEIGSVDAVMMVDLIEHPTDPVCLIETAWAALRPGGVLLLWTPNGGAAGAVTSQAREWLGFRVDLEHLQYLSAATVVAIASCHGWAIEHLESLGFPDLATVAYRPPKRSVVARLRRFAYRSLPRTRVTATALRAARALRRWAAPESKVDASQGVYNLFAILRRPT